MKKNGRDYTTEVQIKLHLQEQKDFKVADISNPWDGKSVNLKDIKIIGYNTILVRYAKLERVAIFNTEDLL
ncbi:MAG: hypothetical protein KAS32_01175 [Candidatus Peribacteraceae bacterium]|nr:hypothetical protein [Candidatus Peribacteraceae bacterium]